MKLRYAVLVGAFVLLSGTSIRLSAPYFSSGMSTQTAHVLTSMRALQDWGFFKLRGISSLVPRSAELEGSVFDSLAYEFNEAVYLSYPSGWLVLPYSAFVLVHAVLPATEIGQPFLFWYNIITDRLGTALLIGLFLASFLSILAGKRLSPLQCGFLALLGCASWLLSPPVLYWTQNAYGMDQAVLPFVAALLFFVARKRCRMSECTHGERAVLFILVFLCCSVDWYGWVAAGITVASCLACELATKRPTNRKLALSYGTVLLAAACASGVYLFQLLSFPGGFRQLVTKFGIRSAHSTETVGFAGEMWLAWREYAPTPLRFRFLIPGLLSSLFLLWKSPEKVVSAALFCALVLPPFIWTALLPQHSATHEFSLLKFALPTAAMIALLGALPAFLLRGRFGIPDSALEGVIRVSVASLAYVITSRHVYVPFVYQDDDWASRIAVLMQASVGSDDLPLSNAKVLTGSRPPHKLWYANRWIYPPVVLRARVAHGLALREALIVMHPVYLRPEDAPVSPDIERLCEGLWKDTGIALLGTRIFECRTDALRSLYLP